MLRPLRAHKAQGAIEMPGFGFGGMLPLRQVGHLHPFEPALGTDEDFLAIERFERSRFRMRHLPLIERKKRHHRAEHKGEEGELQQVMTKRSTHGKCHTVGRGDVQGGSGGESLLFNKGSPFF